ncbi:hypothetical protein BJP34_10160 [Moorena producens PAL-8-15-08-1]|uniref:Uncharacterized protein n=1 Tax=Moorena producens PAL-8-15-08-1 TaxID=1458985 RepID=A0A1D8TQ53_9CYAN|nr:hypothetical protein [Moorena producens]AOW99771.1 hypothetical protein BJP34_10160 [Moorena producens PAL-8-15-08-1]
MMVKTHPLRKQVTPYLGHTEQAATLQSEAGTRAELEVKQISHTTAKGETTWVTVAKILKKCLMALPQSGKQCANASSNPHRTIPTVSVTFEERIGKMDCPKSSKQSDRRNE